jgi:hypothetical protein
LIRIQFTHIPMGSLRSSILKSGLLRLQTGYAKLKIGLKWSDFTGKKEEPPMRFELITV